MTDLCARCSTLLGGVTISIPGIPGRFHPHCVAHAHVHGGSCSPQPPPVCTGTGHVPGELQGFDINDCKALSTYHCGICNQAVAVGGDMRLVLHPYVPQERSR